ncbi:MAG: hypothetical protein MZV70_71215 [Desulfobacterales bacterium]|nr:hypothetical protein [Desulfobacterales bacterium]
MWIVIPVVLAVRRLPYTVRGTFASLLIVHTLLRGGGRERRRHQADDLQGRHPAPDLEGGPGGVALLLHPGPPGGLGHAAAGRPGPRDDDGGHLQLLHRRVGQRGGGPRADPDRARRRLPLRHQPGGRDPRWAGSSDEFLAAGCGIFISIKRPFGSQS